MFNSLMNQMPLTPEGAALRDEILAIPHTDDPMMDDVPQDFDVSALERLHGLALSGSGQAAPELRKLAARYPGFPKLLNYLYVSHVIRKERRQAEAVLKTLAADHPDYLFTRIAFANKALDKSDPERAAAALNPSLALRHLFPERKIFHLSELKNYYCCVARILAQRGETQLAQGVKAALDVIDYDEDTDRLLTREIMMANFMHAKQRMADDAKRRITAKPMPLPTQMATSMRPAFHHEEIGDLYEYGMDLPEECIEAILALPRETLLLDLVAVLEDCRVRTPNFLRGHVAEGEDFAAFHAVHLLAEINGHEACSALLDLLAMHPDAVGFWLGDANAIIPQIARIIAGALPACLNWLKQPGIGSFSKGVVTEAMEQIAKNDPARLPEISGALGKLLAFLQDSPRQDNILDTGYLSILIGTLVELRDAAHLPLIRRAYDMDLVELFHVGSYEEVAEDVSKPIDPPKAWVPMARQYEKILQDVDEDDGGEEDDFTRPQSWQAAATDAILSNPFANRLGNHSAPAPAIEAGRNDPCPCGSGKKFKKCCLR